MVRSGGPSIATDELPTEGTARSALSVFQQKEAAGKSAAPVAAPRQFKHQVDDVRIVSASCTPLMQAVLLLCEASYKCNSYSTYR